ncbi:MAG: alpha/beta hydrolase [Myxococcales bacterium]|nr:MAG: alpha/beta hydrolase [Myxococcales bacterium]
MSELLERSVRVGAERCRVWEKGSGAPLGYLGGLRGLPRWTPFLDRLAERRRVIAPSLPGFPGALGHDRLDDAPDWIAATLDLLEASGLEGADLVGASVGATLAAEVAVFSHAPLRRLVLIAPFGLFDEREPVADLWAQRASELPALRSARPDRLEAALAAPEGEDPGEFALTLHRAGEAAARLLWPLADLGLAKRLHRIRTPTLILWGNQDRVMAPSYAKRFASALSGWVELRQIDAAGHTAEIDAPDAVADAVLSFLSAQG